MARIVKKIKKINKGKRAPRKAAQKAWVAAVNMGYGHQRTAYPLRHLAPKGEVINANDYPGIPEKDKKIWEDSRKFYEAISRFKRLPAVGRLAFSAYDNLFQKIIDFYPRRDFSRPPLLTKQTYGLIKGGWGRHFVERLAKKPLPLVTTFFVPAFMAEEFDYPGEIYLVVCDADISRQWAPLDPINSRINYCAPNRRVAARLKLYGVSSKRIFLTGYPLPEENVFSTKGKLAGDMNLAKHDLIIRLANLDPSKAYLEKYCGLVNDKLCRTPQKSARPLTIIFSAGGAGAQGEIGLALLRQMVGRIKEGKIKIILSAGKNQPLKDFYEQAAKKSGLAENENLEILFEPKIADYFDRFNKALRQTDILWTKPSELSFYSALGLPIIVAPPIGSQEDFNKSWLLKSGFGIEQGKLGYIAQWLDDWLENGYLAEAAMEGFVEGEKMGAANIKKLVFRRDS